MDYLEGRWVGAGMGGLGFTFMEIPSVQELVSWGSSFAL